MRHLSRTSHPLQEEVAKLVTFRNLGSIFEGIAKAYGDSLAEPEPSDPKQEPQG